MNALQDIGNLVFVPRGLRIFILAMLGLTFVAAIALVGYGLIVQSDAGLVATGLGMAQSTATGLLITLLVFYTRRTISFDVLTQATERFLTIELAQCHNAAPSVPFDGREVKLSDRVTHIAGENIATHEIAFADLRMRVRVMLNVRRIVVMYFIPAKSANDLSRYETLLETTFYGAKHAGYEVKFRYSPKDGATEAPHITIFCYNNALEEDFLQNATARFFWAQDIAQMTRSVALELARNSLAER